MRRFFRALPLLLLATLLITLAPGPTAQAQIGVDRRFATYYQEHEGIRLLGYPLSRLLEHVGFPAQYFEKGRIEDHSGAVDDPQWRLMFGRLTAELMIGAPMVAVSGTSLSYGVLREAGHPQNRVAPPPGFTGGVQEVDRPGLGRSTFIPVDPALRPAPGYDVPAVFWDYMVRPDRFPGGWLHDLGLPLTPALATVAVKSGARRPVTLQAFERGVLTLDTLNPPEWMVERGNVGADALAYLPLPETPLIGAPEIGAATTIPLHMIMRVGAPGQRVQATLRWADGTELRDTLTLLRGEDGRGLLCDNLDWGPVPAPPTPPTQSALLEIRTINGTLLARRGVTVLSPTDPATWQLQVFWTVSGTEMTIPQARAVPADTNFAYPPHYWQLSQAERMGTAAINELLWGPPARSQVGFRTALPTPSEVLAFPGRGQAWGYRVWLRSLQIDNGVATADFSDELRAYGGGSLRVKLLREQITLTLQQFPEVHEVRILINGQHAGALEP